jgi:UDP-GlcNAc:undecaprenyl-phosphate/decaprenyl-phosphate GlcNAc-1-phosphate transferase
LEVILSWIAYIGPVSALAITSVLVLWLRPVAKAVGLMDVPNERKIHQGSIPLIGGLSIFVAVFAAQTITGFFVSGIPYPIDYSGFYLAGMLLILVGAVDDSRDLSPLTRLFAEAIAAIIMILGAGVVLYDLGDLWVQGQIVDLGVFSIPFTVFAAIGVINAMNMSDGLDGLAGSLSLVSLAGFIAATVMFGTGEDLGILLTLAAAVTGFLAFNLRRPGRSRAVVFLGDSGSMFLGFALCWFAIKFSQGESRVMAPAAALWFLVLPVFDAVCITSRRVLKRRPAFGADKEHLHHIFLFAGFTVGETVAIMTGMAALGVATGLAGTYFQVPGPILFGAYLVTGLLYLWMIIKSWNVMRFLSLSICRRVNAGDRRSYLDRRENTNVTYLGPERRVRPERRHDPRRDTDSSTIPEQARKSA